MPPETVGQQESPIPLDQNKSVESGVLRPQDIEGLSPEQIDDKVQTAIAKFNVAFEDFDPNKVREAFKKEEPRVTSETLVNDLSGLEGRLKAKLETTADAESPEARKARLGQFVETHFADVCPPKHREAATGECLMRENDMRDLFEEPDLKLSEEDATDSGLKKRITDIVEVTANDETITARTEGREAELKEEGKVDAKIDTDKTMVASEEAKTPMLKARALSKEAKERDVDSDLATVKELQSEFNQLKAEKGTIGALKTLLEPGLLKSPEMRGKVQQVLAQLQSVSKMGSTPEAQTFFQQAVEQSSVNLAGSSPNQIYASLITHIDAGLASGAITQSDANAARVTLGVSPKTTNEPYKIPKDSSQMARDLRERRNTEKQVPKIDPATGEPMVDEDGNIIYETITEENNDVIPIDHPTLEIYLKPEPGSDAYQVHILSDSRLPLVERIDADNFAMGGMREINYLVATADMEQQGFTDMFGSQFTSNEVRRHNFGNFMRSTGMNPDFGSLWTTEHSDRIRQMMQMLHPRGDLGRNDVDPQNWKDRATELGVYDPKADQWDYNALSLWRNSKTFDTVGKDGDALQRSRKAA